MDLQRVEAILRLLQRQDHIREVEVEGPGWRLVARRAPWGASAPVEEPPEQEATAPPPGEPESIPVRASLVGIYRAEENELRLGDFVPEGGSVGHIDSMRILNPVNASEAGYVLAILVEDGDPVEYGQELVRLSRELPPG